MERCLSAPEGVHSERERERRAEVAHCLPPGMYDGDDDDMPLWLREHRCQAAPAWREVGRDSPSPPLPSLLMPCVSRRGFLRW